MPGACVLLLATAALAGPPGPPPDPVALPDPETWLCRYEVEMVYPPPCADGGPRWIYPQAMNEHGHVCGWLSTCGGTDTLPFIWRPETGFTWIPRPQGATNFLPYAINIHDEVAGTAMFGVNAGPFIYFPQVHNTILLTPMPGHRSEIFAMNDDRLMVGRHKPLGGGGQYHGLIVDFMTWTVTSIGPSSQGPSELSAIAPDGLLIGSGYPSLSFRRPLSVRDGALEEIEPHKWAQYAVAHSSPDGRRLLGVTGMAPASVDPPWPGAAYPTIWTGGEVMLLPKRSDAARCAIYFEGPNGELLGSCTMPDSLGNLKHMASILTPDGPLLIADLVSDADRFSWLERPIGVRSDGMIAGRAVGLGPTYRSAMYFARPVLRQVGDVTGDCRVDHRDLLRLLDEWSLPHVPSDIDGDGVVGLMDLLLLLSAWTD
ncbi:MAG: hypothetical protein KF817_04755 [Phycisphaeraceae bacterium]|nr:hypothetical protein [Phycisphaeraceae bacterium]